MNIKQSIALIFLLLGVSFSASASFYYISTSLDGGACYNVGDTVATSYVKQCTPPGYVQASCVRYGNGWINCQRELNGAWREVAHASPVAQCPDGKELNPLTGKCEQVCTEDEALNPDTGECELIPYCERDSTNEALFAAEQACAAENGIFSSECHNGDVVGFPQGLTTKCVQPNECVMGMPHWPECLGDLDPDGGSGVAPPDGDFNGGDLGTSDPTPPTSGQTPPPEIPPSSGSDAATVAAIGTLQSTLNTAIVGVNTDMNQGFSDVNNRLSQLNDTNSAIGQKITDQMNQDYQIHLKEKQLMLQQTGAIQNGAASINKGLSTQTTALTASIDGLAEKIEANKPCDPNEDPRSCEGVSGMTSQLAVTVTGQIDDAVTSGFQGVEKEIIDSAQGLVDDSKLAPVEGHINEAINIAMGAMPSIGDCQSFSIPTPLWGDVEFGCEFSVRFKSVASFLIYIYTIWTLIDILLNGVTPAAGTVPYRSRGI